jgi:hypothetical protein
MDHRPDLPTTNEPRMLIHWDGVANRKVNSNLADGVCWLNPQALIRYGLVNMGLQFHSLNSGAGTIKIEGSMSPGEFADRLKDSSDAWSNAVISKEANNFATISAALASGASVNSTIIYTLLRITFPVGTPCSLSITSM